MKELIITTFSLAIALCLFVTDLHVPEITERDMFGYDAYRVAEGGAILDGDGVVRGWIIGGTVYGPGWDAKYVIPEKDKEG